MLAHLVLSPAQAMVGMSYLAFVAVFVGVAFCVFRALLDPLRDLPGPLAARFSRFWYLKRVNKGQLHNEEVELHKKYGSVVRLAPGQYSFSDKSAFRTIYDHGSKFKKNDFYAPFGPPNQLQANIFQEADINRHAESRRRIATLYSMTSIVSYEPFVDHCIEIFLERFDRFAQRSEAVDITQWMQYFAFDVIGAITVGDPFGFMLHGHDFPGIIREQNSGQAFGVHLGSFAGSWYETLAMIMQKLGKKPGFTATMTYALDSLRKKQADLENGKTALETTGKQDFVEKMLAYKAQGRLNDFQLISVMRSNIAAGSDSTAISLGAILYYLMRHPDKLQKLRTEIEEHKAQQEDEEAFTSFAQAQTMPYLQAVIREALRLHPAIGMQLPRLVPEGGAELAGHFFPAGTIVGVNPAVLHRQTDIFGPDADEFRPERWLEQGDDDDHHRVHEMDRYLLTFGAGARTCLGKHISMLEMQKLIPEVLLRYDFELEDETKDWESLNRFFVYTKYFAYVRMRGRKQ